MHPSPNLAVSLSKVLLQYAVRFGPRWRLAPGLCKNCHCEPFSLVSRPLFSVAQQTRQRPALWAKLSKGRKPHTPAVLHSDRKCFDSLRFAQSALQSADGAWCAPCLLPTRVRSRRPRAADAQLMLSLASTSLSCLYPYSARTVLYSVSVA
jgi:hypothetical protein